MLPFGPFGTIAEITRLVQRVLELLQGKLVRYYLYLIVSNEKSWTWILSNLKRIPGREFDTIARRQEFVWVLTQTLGEFVQELRGLEQGSLTTLYTHSCRINKHLF